jgi:NAD(P)H-flavin reductase
MRHAVHARLGAAGSRRRLFTLLVHTQTLVCAPELEVQACNTYLRRDHASIPGESASNACHVGIVYTCHSHPVGGYEHWAT